MLYSHCLYICSAVQSLPVYVLFGAVIASTYCTYIHTYCCVHVCTYVCIVQKYSMHACMYTCLYILYQNIIMQVQYVNVFWSNIGLFLLLFMQLSWEYMHAHANVPTCLCIFIDAHTSYNRCYYFVIRNTMSKQYAINFFALMMMVMVVLSVAGWRVVCLVFRKLPQL